MINATKHLYSDWPLKYAHTFYLLILITLPRVLVLLGYDVNIVKDSRNGCPTACDGTQDQRDKRSQGAIFAGREPYGYLSYS